MSRSKFEVEEKFDCTRWFVWVFDLPLDFLQILKMNKPKITFGAIKLNTATSKKPDKTPDEAEVSGESMVVARSLSCNYFNRFS